jgi:hypothetical protein
MELQPLIESDDDDISYLKDEDYDSDLSKSDFNEDYLHLYDYIVDEKSLIKLYNGVLLETKDLINNNIKYYKNLNKEIIFESYISSTLTAKGLLKNVDFQNESIISKMTIPTDPKIIKIGCNEEEVYIFPNNYVEYNITHLIDILKNSLNMKYKTRIQCNCKNLIDYRKIILETYDKIKSNIIKIKTSDIFKKIEKYLSSYKNKNKNIIDKIIKIIKKINNLMFHSYLYEDDILIAINEIFEQLQNNHEFERDNNIRECVDLFINIEFIVKFFKNYIHTCKCINHPYEFDKKIPIKVISEDIKKKSSAKLTKKTQRYSRRKINGCGKYFSSQITFEIYGEHTNKIYKIKIFRNGNFQAPGIKNTEMRDIIQPLNTLVNYLKTQFGTDISVSYISSVMRNYLTNIISNPYISNFKDHNNRPKIIGTHIYLDKLEEVCRNEKNAPYFNPEDGLYIYNLLSKQLNNDIATRIIDFCDFSTLKISGIVNNSEKSGGVLIKFDRPIPEKPNKKITVKILNVGKINFDGCNSEIEVKELYYWLHNIFRRYKKILLFDTSRLTYEISDDDGYISLYEN